MIVWGGSNSGGYLNTGGRYNPGTDSWTATSTSNAPAARKFHTSVWSGSEMITWGGGDSAGYSNTGGRYNPTTDTLGSDEHRQRAQWRAGFTRQCGPPVK